MRSTSSCAQVQLVVSRASNMTTSITPITPSCGKPPQPSIEHLTLGSQGERQDPSAGGVSEAGSNAGIVDIKVRPRKAWITSD